eukprot:scaffold2145_cov309-Prasinococcus_capsulatus_cf.AAC.5
MPEGAAARRAVAAMAAPRRCGVHIEDVFDNRLQAYFSLVHKNKYDAARCHGMACMRRLPCLPPPPCGLRLTFGGLRAKAGAEGALPGRGSGTHGALRAVPAGDRCERDHRRAVVAPASRAVARVRVPRSKMRRSRGSTRG